MMLRTNSYAEDMMQVMDWRKRKKELCTMKCVNVFLLSGLSQKAAEGIFISILKDSWSSRSSPSRLEVPLSTYSNIYFL